MAAACLFVCVGMAFAATGGPVATTVASQLPRTDGKAAEGQARLEKLLAGLPRAQWRASLDEILDGDPDDLIARAVRVPIALEGGDPATALADAEAVLAADVFRDERRGAFLGMRASALACLSRGTEAIEVAERAMALDPAGAFGYIGRGIARMGLGQTEAALEDFRRAVDLDSGNALARYSLGAALKAQDRDGERAIAELRQALAINSSSLRWHQTLGMALEDAGDHGGAVEEFDAVLREQPDDAQALAFRSKALFALHRLDETIADATRVIELETDTRIVALAYANRAAAWNAKGDTAQALADLNRVIESAPEIPASYAMRATLLMDQGDHAGAIADLMHAEHLGMDNVDSTLGQALFFHGDFAEAARHFDAHLQQHPDDAYRALLRYLARARADAADEPAARAQLMRFGSERAVRPWPSRLVALLAGQIDAPTLRADADAAAPGERAGQQCEAAYYDGQRLVLLGQADGARAHFAEAASECPRTFLEYKGAKAELATR
jgi:tetratricopeptide (TPR) repeat protein